MIATLYRQAAEAAEAGDFEAARIARDAATALLDSEAKPAAEVVSLDAARKRRG